MPREKWYAVFVGRVPGVYPTWDACNAQVLRFPGARFKSFPSRAEAARALDAFSADRPLAQTAPARASAAPPAAVSPGAAAQDAAAQDDLFVEQDDAPVDVCYDEAAGGVVRCDTREVVVAGRDYRAAFEWLVAAHLAELGYRLLVPCAAYAPLAGEMEHAPRPARRAFERCVRRVNSP